jgi:hypothetical protein
MLSTVELMDKLLNDLMQTNLPKVVYAYYKKLALVLYFSTEVPKEHRSQLEKIIKQYFPVTNIRYFDLMQWEETADKSAPVVCLF